MRFVRSCLILVLAVACSDPTQPAADPVDGTYALRQTPVVLPAPSGTLEILADTLRISGNSATRTVYMEFGSDPSTPQYSDWTTSYTVSWRFRRTPFERIELQQICPPNALMLCLPPPHAWGDLDGELLRLRHRTHPDVVLEYERIPGVRIQ